MSKRLSVDNIIIKIFMKSNWHSVVTERLDRRLVNGELVAEEGNNSMLDTWIRDGHKDYRKMVTFLSDMVLASIDTVCRHWAYSH